MEWSRLLVSAITGALFGILANIWLHRRSQWIEMQTLCRSLAREVELITRKLEEYHAAARGAHRLKWPHLSIDLDDMLIFRANGSKLGLLEASLVFRTMKFYGMVRAAVAAAHHLESRPHVGQRAPEDDSAVGEAAAAADSAAKYARTGAATKGPEHGLIVALESFARVGWWQYQLRAGSLPLRRWFERRNNGDAAE